MKKQRIRPQDYPLLYDPHVLAQTNTLTHSSLYSRFTWRQDLHSLHAPLVPTEVEAVFVRNEETKRQTDKMKLLRAIFADQLGLNAKEPRPVTSENDQKSREKTAQQMLETEEMEDDAYSAWKTNLPKHKIRHITARSRVPLHMMTSATLAPLPLEKLDLDDTKRTKFLQYASDPRFRGLVDLVKRKSPNSALLGGTSRAKGVTWADGFSSTARAKRDCERHEPTAFLAQLQNTDDVLTFDRPGEMEVESSLSSTPGYYYLRPDEAVALEVQQYLSMEDGGFLIYPLDFDELRTRTVEDEDE